MTFGPGDKILVLAPHTDDAEFGCGGTIARMVDSGATVHIAAFSACKQSVHPNLPEDILITEAREAAGLLGIEEGALHLYDYAVRTFDRHRQDILENMIQLRESLRPDVIFMPSSDDIHQDHQVIHNEGLRAFKFCTIFCYEMPWNNMQFKTSAFIGLSEAQLQRKIRAVECYKSQAHRPYANAEFVKSLALTRGVQVSQTFAEAFDIIRYIS